MASFLDTAKEKVLFFDGAMGTSLFAYNLTAEDYGGDQYDGCPEYLNITKPEIIKEIHRKFFEAGADVVETNTFGSSKLVLAEYDLEDRAYELSKLAASLAREVADEFMMKEGVPGKFVAGSIGPGTKLASLGHTKYEVLRDSYLDQVRGLIDGGSDLLIIETCQDPLQIKAALNACFSVFNEIDLLGETQPGLSCKELEEKLNDHVDDYAKQSSSISEEEILKKYPKAIIVPDKEQRTGLLGRVRFPLQVQVTVEQTGTMLVGADIASALTTITAYPVDVVGMNCATGPQEMIEHIQHLCNNSPVLVSCIPNAGIPENRGGHPHYPLGPSEFAEHLSKFVKDYGVNIIGGCCGTTYDHINSLVATVGATTKPKSREAWSLSHKKTITKEDLKSEVAKEFIEEGPQNSVSSLYQSVPMQMEPAPLIVGERTNANGSKLFRELLADDDYDGIVSLAKEQEVEGAHVLDLCTAYVGRDETKDMHEVVKRLNTTLNIPLMIDSTEAPVIEDALKNISGKAIINSVNLEDGEERVAQIAGLCNKYGAALVVLTIDEDGMAKTAQKKFEIGCRLYELLVNKHGMNPRDLIYDTLTFTLGAGDDDLRSAGIETIEAIRMIKEKYPEVKTILGVSNISFGLDAKLRTPLNSVFLHECIKAGLDMAIANRRKILPLNQIEDKVRKACEDLVYDKREFDGDKVTYDPLFELINCLEHIKEEASTKKNPYEGLEVEKVLEKRIINGDKVKIDIDLDKALSKGYAPLEIINQFLMNGMKVVGDLFGAGEMQLPFVLQSATAMKTAVAHLEQFMEKKDADAAKGTIVLATVKGDVHDIGKNLVAIILSNNGFKVHDLGIKQPIEDILHAIDEHKPDMIGLSGLLVKSTLIMKQGLEAMNDRNCNVPVILGGAALTRRFVEEDCANVYNGTVFYGFDAFTDLALMEKLCSGVPAAKIKEEFYKTKAKELVAAGASSSEPGAVSATSNDSPYQKVQESIETSSQEQENLDPYTFTEQLSSVRTIESTKMPEAPFWGAKTITSQDIDLDEMWKYLNLDALIIGQWRFGKGKQDADVYQKHLDETIYPTLERLKQDAKANGWIEPRISYGYFPCKVNSGDPNKLDLYWLANDLQAEDSQNKNNLDLFKAQNYNPSEEFKADNLKVVESFNFPRKTSGEHLCLTDYFRTQNPDEFNMVGFQIVTVGAKATEHCQKLYEDGDFTNYLYANGLSVESAEALAEYSHANVRKELGYANEDHSDIKKLLRCGYHGMRYSFGYPACPNLEDHEQLFRLLNPQQIGIKLSDEWQLHPEQSTSAIIIHHPDGKYFNI